MGGDAARRASSAWSATAAGGSVKPPRFRSRRVEWLLPSATLVSGRDLALLVALAAWAGGAVALAPIATCFGFGVVLALLAARGLVRERAALALALVFALAGGRAVVAEHHARAAYEQARALVFPIAFCDFEAEVVASPQARGDVEKTTVEVTTGTCAESPIPARTRFDVSAHEGGLRRGDLVSVQGSFALVHAFENPELPPSWVRFARTGTSISGFAEAVTVLDRGRGLATAIDEARARVRARIRATYHPDAEALGRALVLGETDLDPEVNDAFRATGLSHVLAVSGTHLVVSVMAIAAALRALLLRFGNLAVRVDVARIAAVIAIPAAWIYADFAGGSGSVVRAAAMMTAVLGARVLDRRAPPSRSLAAAMLLGSALDPVVVADVSFTLSTASTIGLLVLSRPIARLLRASEGDGEETRGAVRRAWSVVGSAIATTLGATLACAPVTAVLSPTVPVAGVGANLVAAPLGETFALPFAMAHALLSPFPWLESGAARAASGALRGVLLVARAAKEAGVSLPVPAPTAYHVVVLAIGVAWIASRSGRRARLVALAATALALVAVEGSVRARMRPRGQLRVTAIDVGQGDAIAIDLPDGSFMLVDAGGFPGQAVDTGERVVAPVLRARRRDRIDWLVLSHPHPDHYGGLATTLKRASSVGELWDNGHGASVHNRTVDEVTRGVGRLGGRIVPLAELCAGPRSMGGAIVEVLSPCPTVDEDASVNDGSLVLKITYGRRSVLLMGDAERGTEERLLRSRPDDLRADLLKVGHHGSRTSTSRALAEAVAPDWAVISCGVRNRFGHPNAETLDTLAAVGAHVARTDIGGAFTWSTDGERVWVNR